MGRSTHINYNLVSETANTLIAENKNCTLVSIHKIVGGSLSTVSKYWKEYKINNGLDILKKPQIKNPSDDLNTIFQSEVKRQVIEVQEDFEAKFREKKIDEEYQCSYMAELENRNKELEASETESREKYLFMAGEKAAAESRVKELVIKLENVEEQFQKALMNTASLEGALQEARNLLNVKLEEIAAKIQTEPLRKGK
jgi:hypothetical protein